LLEPSPCFPIDQFNSIGEHMYHIYKHFHVIATF
jgi:hypothetical protein